MKKSVLLSMVAILLVILGAFYFIQWLYHETNLLFVIGTILFVGLACLFQLKLLYILEQDHRQEKRDSRLGKDLKYNREKLFSQIQKLVKWHEMSRQDFEDTLDLINGYSEEEIQKKYQEKY